jgi:hypothetical protein
MLKRWKLMERYFMPIVMPNGLLRAKLLVKALGVENMILLLMFNPLITVPLTPLVSPEWKLARITRAPTIPKLDRKY